MKAKKLLFHATVLMVFLLLGCSSDDASSVPNEASKVPNAPVGNRSQLLSLGSTVSDIIVSGENIKWYQINISAANPSYVADGVLFDQETTNNRILLSPETKLQDRKIYFATQTIDNIESASYLPVTVRVMNIVR
jgi:uncharacterized protein YcfL